MANHFKSIENIRNATFEELIQVNEIGDRIASSIIDYFKDEKNLQIIDKLKNAGLQLQIIQSEDNAIIKSTSGQNICYFRYV
ncbi:MAG: hypothetical protein MZV63_28490 [Marinilabiliales bacterium]|nr:hypothetical protein [Marinilabiliales bacterium]